MSRRRVPLPSPAMAVALCALFVALGGASYALTVPRNSVGPNQLRTHAVTSTKLGTGAVTARAVRDGAISGRKIGSGSVHASDLASGAVRTAGLANGAVTGVKLAPNSVAAAQLTLPVVSVQAFSAVLPANQNGFRTVGATCPANDRVVGGGGGWVGAESTDAIGYGAVAGSRPTPPAAGTDAQNGWEVYGTDAANPIDRRLMVIAICIAT
jgi:trimeric autotransporter adhesin